MCKKPREFVTSLVTNALQAENFELHIEDLNSLRNALCTQVSSIYTIFDNYPSLRKSEVAYIYNRVNGNLGVLCTLFLHQIYGDNVNLNDEPIDNARRIALTRAKVLLESRNDMLRERFKNKSRERFRVYFPVFLGVIGALVGTAIGAWATLYAAKLITWPFK